MSKDDKRGTNSGRPPADIHRISPTPAGARQRSSGDDETASAGRGAKWATMSRAMRERAAAAATPRIEGRGRGGRLARRDHAVCSFRLAPEEAEIMDRALRLLNLEARARGKADCRKSDALRGAVLAFMNDIVANGVHPRHFEVIENAL